ncbi:MAG: hypothetical protein KDD25_05505 [Bdellovibrionales bacterium]|nr:hypothetical protein [Bdellovibrionales bacterium]
MANRNRFLLVIIGLFLILQFQNCGPSGSGEGIQFRNDDEEDLTSSTPPPTVTTTTLPGSSTTTSSTTTTVTNTTNTSTSSTTTSTVSTVTSTTLNAIDFQVGASLEAGNCLMSTTASSCSTKILARLNPNRNTYAQIYINGELFRCFRQANTIQYSYTVNTTYPSKTLIELYTASGCDSGNRLEQIKAIEVTKYYSGVEIQPCIIPQGQLNCNTSFKVRTTGLSGSNRVALRVTNATVAESTVSCEAPNAYFTYSINWAQADVPSTLYLERSSSSSNCSNAGSALLGSMSEQVRVIGVHENFNFPQ